MDDCVKAGGGGTVEPKTISPPDSEVLCPRVARFSFGSGRPASPCNTSRPKVEPHPYARRLRFTELQISREEVVVRHIGKDATTLYEFKSQWTSRNAHDRPQ
jgi:hypothetical protein